MDIVHGFDHRTCERQQMLRVIVMFQVRKSLRTISMTLSALRLIFPINTAIW
jgi:hypothetical protein